MFPVKGASSIAAYLHPGSKSHLLLSLVLLSLAFSSCTKDSENQDEPPGFVDYFTADTNNPDDPKPQLRIKDLAEGLDLYMYGLFDEQGKPYRSQILAVDDKEEQVTGVYLLDDQFQPAFFWRFNHQTQEADTSLIEFELENENRISVRIYTIDWSTNNVVLRRAVSFVRVQGGIDSYVYYVDISGESPKYRLNRFDELLNTQESNYAGSGNEYSSILPGIEASLIQPVWEMLEDIGSLEQNALDSAFASKISSTKWGYTLVAVAAVAIVLVFKKPLVAFLKRKIDSWFSEPDNSNTKSPFTSWLGNNLGIASATAAELSIIDLIIERFQGVWSGWKQGGIWPAGTGPSYLMDVTFDFTLSKQDENTATFTVIEEWPELPNIPISGSGSISRGGLVSCSMIIVHNAGNPTYSFITTPKFSSSSGALTIDAKLFTPWGGGGVSDVYYNLEN